MSFYFRPVRQYYANLCQRMDQEDIESGWFNDELSSIRVDPSYPSEGDTVPFPHPPPPDPSSPPPKGNTSASYQVSVPKMPAGTFILSV